MSLVERGQELAAIDEVLAATRGGDGAGLAIEGPPGIGKSALLAAAREAALAAGLRVRSARCSELERDFAFGVTRQSARTGAARRDEDERARLLDGPASFAQSVLAEVGVGAGAPAEVDLAMRAFHALYGLVAHASAERPLCLLVDDAHWADASLLRWLAYLAGSLVTLQFLSFVFDVQPRTAMWGSRMVQAG